MSSSARYILYIHIVKHEFKMMKNTVTIGFLTYHRQFLYVFMIYAPKTEIFLCVCFYWQCLLPVFSCLNVRMKAYLKNLYLASVLNLSILSWNTFRLLVLCCDTGKDKSKSTMITNHIILQVTSTKKVSLTKVWSGHSVITLTKF